MNAAQSLRSSANAFYRAGRETDANFCRSMAESAERMGDLGEPLYSHWAKQMADRVIAKQQDQAA